MSKTLVEAADDVEDKGAIGDHLAEGREVIGHLVQLAAVLGGGEVALDEVAKPRLQLNGASLAVSEKLQLDGKPGVPGCRALSTDDLAQVIRERGDDLGLDNVVHPGPIRRYRDWKVFADMALERKLAEDQQKLVAPAVEVTGVDVEDGGDVVPDVADGDSLGVKLKQGHGFVVKHGCT